MNNVFLCLGSNLGDRRWYLSEAIRQLDMKAGPVCAASPVYESEGWGTNSGKKYLNQVVELIAPPEPWPLLLAIGKIEAGLGRIRGTERNEDRVIDIDILFYGQVVMNHRDLQIPHPRLHLRRFVLVPLNDLAPDFVHPVLKQPVRTLLRECPDNLFVNTFHKES
jgi:2-amino-4-hydroxy-6-hydroxymethyldihydropteridine diphosphokinase